MGRTRIACRTLDSMMGNAPYQKARLRGERMVRATAKIRSSERHLERERVGRPRAAQRAGERDRRPERREERDERRVRERLVPAVEPRDERELGWRDAKEQIVTSWELSRETHYVPRHRSIVRAFVSATPTWSTTEQSGAARACARSTPRGASRHAARSSRAWFGRSDEEGRATALLTVSRALAARAPRHVKRSETKRNAP